MTVESPARPRGRPTLTARRLAALAVVATLAVAACGSDGGDRELAGFVRSPTPEVTGATLPDAAAGGEEFSFAADPGELKVIYFGYTSCPDVCPTTMADLSTALDDLDDEEAERVEVAMATVDPGRDTAGVLTDYVQSFIEGGHALRTDDPERLQAAADQFGVTYQVTENDEGEIEVGHSGNLYLVDDQGRLRVTWPFGTPYQDIRDDIDQVLAEEEQ